MLEIGNAGADCGLTFCQMGIGFTLASDVRHTAPLSSVAQITFDPVAVADPPVAIALTFESLEVHVPL